MIRGIPKHVEIEDDFKLFQISLVKEGGIPMLKKANGDMIQYFMDNPDKLKEKLERDKKKKMKKTAAFLPDISILMDCLNRRTNPYYKKLVKTARVDSADKNPTEGQKEAGNYKKGHIKYDGMDITIENPAGSYREGVSRSGVKWKNKINHHYGYIKRTLGKDGDHVDVFIKPGTTSTKMVYVINQHDPSSGKFDEHKCMLGFDSMEEAKKAYLSNYDKGWKGLKSAVPMTIDNFKKWVYKGRRSNPAEKAVEKVAYLNDIYFYGIQDEILKMTR